MTDPQPLSPQEEAALRKTAEATRDLLANYLWNEDDSGDDNDLIAAYDRLAAILGPSTEEGVGHTLAAEYTPPATLDAARATPAAPDLRAAAEAVVDTYDHGLREAGPRGWDALIDGLRAALAAPDAGERPEHRPTYPNIAFDRDGEDGSGDVWCAECAEPWPCSSALSQPSRDALDMDVLATTITNLRREGWLFVADIDGELSGDSTAGLMVAAYAAEYARLTAAGESR